MPELLPEAGPSLPTDFDMDWTFADETFALPLEMRGDWLTDEEQGTSCFSISCGEALTLGFSISDSQRETLVDNLLDMEDTLGRLESNDVEASPLASEDEVSLPWSPEPSTPLNNIKPTLTPLALPYGLPTPEEDPKSITAPAPGTVGVENTTHLGDECDTPDEGSTPDDAVSAESDETSIAPLTPAPTSIRSPEIIGDSKTSDSQTTAAVTREQSVESDAAFSPPLVTPTLETDHIDLVAVKVIDDACPGEEASPHAPPDIPSAPATKPRRSHSSSTHSPTHCSPTQPIDSLVATMSQGNTAIVDNECQDSSPPSSPSSPATDEPHGPNTLGLDLHLQPGSFEGAEQTSGSSAVLGTSTTEVTVEPSPSAQGDSAVDSKSSPSVEGTLIFPLGRAAPMQSPTLSPKDTTSTKPQSELDTKDVSEEAPRSPASRASSPPVVSASGENSTIDSSVEPSTKEQVQASVPQQPAASTPVRSRSFKSMSPWNHRLSPHFSGGAIAKPGNPPSAERPSPSVTALTIYDEELAINDHQHALLSSSLSPSVVIQADSTKNVPVDRRVTSPVKKDVTQAEELNQAGALGKKSAPSPLATESLVPNGEEKILASGSPDMPPASLLERSEPASSPSSSTPSPNDDMSSCAAAVVSEPLPRPQSFHSSTTKGQEALSGMESEVYKTTTDSSTSGEDIEVHSPLVHSTNNNTGNHCLENRPGALPDQILLNTSMASVAPQTRIDLRRVPPTRSRLLKALLGASPRALPANHSLKSTFNFDTTTSPLAPPASPVDSDDEQEVDHLVTLTDTGDDTLRVSDKSTEPHGKKSVNEMKESEKVTLCPASRSPPAEKVCTPPAEENVLGPKEPVEQVKLAPTPEPAPSPTKTVLRGRALEVSLLLQGSAAFGATTPTSSTSKRGARSGSAQAFMSNVKDTLEKFGSNVKPSKRFKAGSAKTKAIKTAPDRGLKSLVEYPSSPEPSTDNTLDPPEAAKEALVDYPTSPASRVEPASLPEIASPAASSSAATPIKSKARRGTITRASDYNLRKGLGASEPDRCPSPTPETPIVLRRRSTRVQDREPATGEDRDHTVATPSRGQRRKATHQEGSDFLGDRPAKRRATLAVKDTLSASSRRHHGVSSPPAIATSLPTTPRVPSAPPSSPPIPIVEKAPAPEHARQAWTTEEEVILALFFPSSDIRPVVSKEAAERCAEELARRGHLPRSSGAIQTRVRQAWREAPKGKKK